MTTKEQGLSLTDIGPLSESVLVHEGKSVQVYGVSAKGIFAVFQQFPDVMQWFKGGKFDIQSLVAEAPDALAAVIAAACGQPGDKKAQEIAERLPAEVQLDILEAAGRLTFKSGFGPFVNRIVALSNAAASVNYGRALDTKSPPESKPSLPPASEPSSSGT